MIWTTFATWYESKICLKNNIDAVLLTKKSSGQPFDHLSHQKCSWPYFNLRSFSPNYGKIPQFTGFVNKDWIVEKVAQKATIRNSVMQPCAAFHSRCVHALQGILLLSKWYTCCLRRNTHTHTISETVSIQQRLYSYWCSKQWHLEGWSTNVCQSLPC